MSMYLTMNVRDLSKAELKQKENEIKEVFDDQHFRELREKGEQDRALEIFNKRKKFQHMVAHGHGISAIDPRILTCLAKYGDKYTKHSILRQAQKDEFWRLQDDTIIQLILYDDLMETFLRNWYDAKKEHLKRYISIISVIFKKGNSVSKEKLFNKIKEETNRVEELNLGDIAFEYFAQNGDDELIMRLIRNRYLSGSALDFLARKYNDYNETLYKSDYIHFMHMEIGENIARHPNILASTVEYLINEAFSIREAIFENPSLPKIMKESSLKDKSFYFLADRSLRNKIIIARNMNISENVINHLLGVEYYYSLHRDGDYLELYDLISCHPNSSVRACRSARREAEGIREQHRYDLEKARERVSASIEITPKLANGYSDF